MNAGLALVNFADSIDTSLRLKVESPPVWAGRASALVVEEEVARLA